MEVCTAYKVKRQHRSLHTKATHPAWWKSFMGKWGSRLFPLYSLSHKCWSPKHRINVTNKCHTSKQCIKHIKTLSWTLLDTITLLHTVMSGRTSPGIFIVFVVLVLVIRSFCLGVWLVVAIMPLRVRAYIDLQVSTTRWTSQVVVSCISLCLGF